MLSPVCTPRIDVLDRADDDEVVRAVAHDLELNSFQPMTDCSTRISCTGLAELGRRNLAELLDVV
jgi:hypothetical protein